MKQGGDKYMEEGRTNSEKGNGEPYVEQSWEKYNKMTDEEKAEADALRKKLFEKFGISKEE